MRADREVGTERWDKVKQATYLIAGAMRRNCLISKPIDHSSIIHGHPTRIVFRYRNELQRLTNEITPTGKTRSWVDTNWQSSPHGDGTHDIMTIDPTLNKSSFMQHG